MLKKRHVQEAGISSPAACAGWRGPGSAGAKCTFGSSVAAGAASIQGTVPADYDMSIGLQVRTMCPAHAAGC